MESVVGWYDIWTGDLPFAQFTLKVIQLADGGFAARPNVFVKSGEGIEYTGGYGASIEAAVIDAVEQFYAEIEKVAPITEITEGAFVWLCWTPFGPTSQ